jgi:hypothetical protein
MNAAKALRQQLADPTTHFVPACYDAMSARMIRDAGYPLTFLSGYQVSATRVGLPDTGYLTLTEMTSQVREVTTQLPGFPVIVDADTGYGNAMNVRRTVMELSKAGAAGLMLEDQVMPKRCGHIGAKAVISRQEAVAKLRAAADAREESGQDIVILARTDSRRSWRRYRVHGVVTGRRRNEGIRQSHGCADVGQQLTRQRNVYALSNPADIAGDRIPYRHRSLASLQRSFRHPDAPGRSRGRRGIGLSAAGFVLRVERNHWSSEIN